MALAEATRCRLATEADLPRLAELGAAAFSGLRPAERGLRWIRTSWAASDRFEYWVIESHGRVAGYILWAERGGFREKAVLELEQITVDSSLRNRGLATRLVRNSLEGVKARLADRGAELKLVEVTTGTHQSAMGFYRQALGAEPVAVIPDLFGGDECVMIARKGQSGLI
jgi:ribosomal protein S18 acetylase RimI-like enzyme